MPKPRTKTIELRRRIRSFIRQFRRENRYGPNLREIAEAVGISSASNVNYHVKPMIAEGMLTGDGNARSLNVPDGIPIVGTVGASTPESPVTVVMPEAITWDQVDEFDTVEFPDWLIGSVAEPYALQVTGDSMIDACILDGDFIIMEKISRATRGDMIVANIMSRQEFTLKRYYPSGPVVTLQPENPTLEPMVEAADDIRIEGRVIGVVRRY